MSVDILAIGENNRKKQEAQNKYSVINPWKTEPGQVEPISPKTKVQQTLDKQVEIGLGTRLDNIMTKKDKQLYADGLSEGDRNLMQRYKAEGYSFEASKAMVEQKKELANPLAQGVSKFKDYQAKEQYYNKTGGTVDPSSNLYKIGTFLQRIGFDDQYGNPLNKLAQEYNDRYMKEREAVDTIMEDEEATALERLGWWLERTLLTAESGIITGLGKVGNAIGGIEDIKSSALDATLDRAILGYDTDLDYYRQEDRRLDEYLWEGASGGLNTIFWAWAPKIMAAFTALGETKKGGEALESLDGFIKGVNQWAAENITEDYWNSLDEQGKEDMLDTITTVEYMLISRKTNKRTAKLKGSKAGIEYSKLKAQNRAAIERGIKGAKEQVKAEVKNVKEATDLYNEQGKVVGKVGPEGQTGLGKSTARVIDAAVKEYKQSFIDRLNARHGGTIAEPGTPEPTGSVAKPTESPDTKKGGIKDLATQTWDSIITGLTPEERVRIQNDPYTIDMWNKAKQMLEEAGMPLEDSFITEQLYSEIGNNIIKTFEEWDKKLEDIEAYKELRKNTNLYVLSSAIPEIEAVLNANDITVDPISKELDFSNSKFVSDADMRSVERAMTRIYRDLGRPLTAREYLNMRDILKQLASYSTVDASRGQSLIRQLRHTANETAHKIIPGLKDADKITSKYYNEIEELKDGWVYKGGDRKGQIRNNFYSIIKNLTGQNRKVMLDRLEKYYPGIGEQIEAIHIVNKIVKAYNKSPQMLNSLGLGGAVGGTIIQGGVVGLLIGALAGEMIKKGIIEPRTKSARRGAIDKLLSQMSPEALRKLQAIAVRQLTAKEISKADQEVLDRVVEMIKKERESGGLTDTAIKERKGKGMFSKGGNVPQFKEIKFPSRNLYELETEEPLEKFDGTLTAEQKREGRELYQIANKDLDRKDMDSDREIIAARGKFLVMNQKPGYTKALGLDQGKVNESITKRWEQNGGAGEKAIQFNRWINDGAKPQYRFMGISNLITTANPWRGIDAINYLVKDVKTAEDPTKVDYKPRIDATIDSLLLMDSHFNYGEMNVRFTTQAEMNKYALELAKNKANGEFVADILSLIGGQGKETIPHETGHGADAIMGIELFGPEFIRKRGTGEMYATGKAARSYYKDNVWDGKWRDGLEYKTPEAMEFHKQLLDLMDKIEIPEWMKNDLSLDEDGNPMFEYRTRPEEVWARFHQANIRLTRDISEGGRIPKKYKSDHGDTYPIELYKEWVQLLQKHQELAENGAFHKVEPINRSGISTMNGLRNYPRQKTPEELEHYAGKMIETWGDVVNGFDINVMLDKFDPDLRKRQKRVEKVKGKDNMYSDNDFMDFFLTLKAMSKDPEFMEGLKLRAERIKKAQENGTAYGSENITRLYDMLSRKDLKLTAPKGQRDIDVVNEELLEPIRRWLIQSGIARSSFKDIFATLGTNYSPDTIQWQNNIDKSASWSFRSLKVKDLKELEGYIKDLIEKGEVNLTGYDPILGSRRYTQYTINGEMPDRLIDVVERGIGDTFTDKRIKEVANDMWDNVMDPMGDIFKDAIVGGQHVPPSEINEFYGKIYYAMGETYTTDMKERTRAVNEEIKKIGNEMGIALNRDRVVPEQKLQGLNAKLRELMAVGPYLGEYIVKEREFDYNPTRSRWIRDLVKGAYERMESNVAQTTTEATKQLVALSNIDVSNFEKQIKNFGGKSPMPSIAVTDINVPHTAFGDLTLVFGRDTVDPQADPRNKIYASDAWTTTFPDTKDAGGFRWDNAKELAGLIKDKITTSVDSLTLTETGLDPSTIDLLANRIVNAILDNGYDAEYLKGWQDVGDMTVEQAVDNIGLDRYENEGLYQDLQNLVANYVKEHQPTQVIPGYYFKGQVRYQDRNAIQEVVDKVWDNLPEKGIQKLKDDGWSFDESDNKYVINQRHKDAPPKEGIQRDLTDLIERIDDYPNISVESAGQQYVDLLTKEYGFERKLAIEIAESIFGDIAKERLSKQQFAEKIHYHLPLNDGDMGEDFGTMHDKNLGPMVGDMLAHTEDLAENLLDQYDKGYIEAEGDRIIDRLLDEWETDVHNDIENYVVVELRERAIGEEPSMDAEEKWRKEEGEQQTSEIMGGVDASLTDMKLYVKDVANEGLLVENVSKDRPLTPENVLDAMRNQGGPRRDVTEGSLRDLVGVEGKEFTDIEQVRGKNLAKTTHDDRTGDLSAIEKRYDTIIDEIRREFTEGEPDIPMEMSSQVVKQEIAWNYDSDLETFKNNLLEENDMWDIIPDDYLQAIIDCVEMGKQVPVRFSESKPERIVDLYKEVEYILAPKQDISKVNDIVRGTPLEGKVHMYDRSGFKSERSDRIKSLQKRYGNIFFSMGGVIMPIAMLLLMIQQEETA